MAWNATRGATAMPCLMRGRSQDFPCSTLGAATPRGKFPPGYAKLPVRPRLARFEGTAENAALTTPARHVPCTAFAVPTAQRRRRVPVFLAFSVVLAMASPVRADIGVIVAEPVSALGFFTRVGHVSTYLSAICPDGSPIRMRPCRSGESGGVVIRSATLSENEDYDWAIVPFDEYLHGFASSDLAPLIGTRKLQRAIEGHDFTAVFSGAMTTTHGAAPEGQWKAALATRFDRGMYLFSVATTAADDATIIAAFNAAPNKSRFNFFYQNCSDQAKGIFDLVLPSATGDRTSGITMQTPKGLAKALVSRALAHPELNLRVRRYPQMPGTFGASRGVLFPMENAYRNIAFAPYWFWGGFREVALGAMFYHEVASPFDVIEAFRDFMSARAADLTLEQHRLRKRQDAIRLALISTRRSATERSRLSALNASVFRRLGQIRTEKRAEVARVEGTRAQWRGLDREFRSMVRGMSGRLALREELQQPLARIASNERSSRELLRLFEADGEFYVDRGGPWLRLPLNEGEWGATGVSTSQILAGDPRVALLVLAAVIDHNLRQSSARREDITYVNGLISLFRQASEIIGRQANGAGAQNPSK
jgi:hypothetical protein